MENNSVMIESLVLSSIFQDMTLINEYPLSEEHFKNPKCKFYYQLAKGLSSYKELTEYTVASWIGQNKTLEKTYKDYGGYESIEKVKSLGNSINYDKYVDDLFKQVLIENLREKGFNVNKRINIEGNEVRPSDLFGEFTCEQVYNFYNLLLNDATINTNSSDLKIDQLYYTEEDLEKKKNGELDFTLPFDTTLTWIDENGKDRYFRPLKILNDQLDGMPTKNGLILNAGSSGSGKSTLTFNQAMGLIEAGSKVLYCSNEQNVEYFREILICYIAKVVFKKPSIKKKKVRHLNLTDDEYKIFIKCNKFIKDKYEGKLFFISVSDFDVNRIMKMAKRLNLSDNVDTLILETFKSESALDDSVNNMVENSRQLDKFGRQNNMRIILPVQTRTSDEGVISYLTATSLSGSKQIKEVANSLILIRKVTKEELDESNKKMFISPYRWEFNDETNKYEKKFLKIKKEKEVEVVDEDKPKRRRRLPTENIKEEQYDINPDDAWRLIFIDKNRNSSDGKIILARLNGEHGIFECVGYANHVYEGRLRGY